MDPHQFLHEHPTSVFPAGDPRRYFHPSWYSERYLGSTTPDVDPWDHYVLVGERSGALPHPLFSPTYYRSQAQEHGGLALEHYARFGVDRMIHPHPLLRPTRPGQDLNWFVHNDDPQTKHLVQTAARKSSASTLMTYLLATDSEWRHPNPLFDRAWYREHVGEEIDRFGDPLSHYLAIGGYQGLPTGSGIEWRPFLQRRPDLLLQSRTPMEHALLHEVAGSFTFGAARPEALITSALSDGNLDEARRLIAAWYLDDSSEWASISLSPTPITTALEIRELSGALLLHDYSFGNMFGSPGDVHLASFWWAAERCVLLKRSGTGTVPSIDRCELFDPNFVTDPIALQSAVSEAKSAGIPLVTSEEVADAFRLYSDRCGVDLDVRSFVDGVAVGEVLTEHRDLGPIIASHPATIHLTARSGVAVEQRESVDGLTGRGLLALLNLLPRNSEVTVSESFVLSPATRRRAEAAAQLRDVKVEFAWDGATR